MKNSKKILFLIFIVAFAFFFIGAAEYNEELSDGTYKEDDNTNAPYVTDTVIEETISQTEDEDAETEDLKTAVSADGGYKLDINLDEMTREIIEELETNNAGLETYFTYQNMEEYLKKMIKAELITQYPDLRSADKIGSDVTDGNEFQGVIKFVRHKSDGTTQVLQYIPLGTATDSTNSSLYGMINQANQSGSGSVDILNYFSIDKNGNLIVVQKNQTITKTISGSYETGYKSNEEEALYNENDRAYLNSAPSQVTYSYSKHSIDYKTVMAQYTMPFEYLWAFLVTSKDEEFVSDLADLVLESEIEVGIYDGEEINEELNIRSFNTNNWKKTRTVLWTLTKNETTGEYEETNRQVGEWSNPATITTTHHYDGTYTKNTKDLLTIKITKADTWYMESVATFISETTGPSNQDLINYQVTRHTESDESLEEGNGPSGNIRYEEGVERSYADDESTILYRRIDNLLQSKNNQNMTIFANNSIKTEYVSEGTPQIKEKTKNSLKEGDEGYPNFSTLFLNSKIARDNIKGAETGSAEWLFEILANNQTTANMVDLTKYMLYCATGISYDGIETFDFSIYNSVDFIQVGPSSTELLSQYTHYWESSGAPPTNVDGTKYIIHDDGAGHPTVGYGVDIENCGYTDLFEEYAEEHGISLTYGEEIDIEFVDGIEEMVMNDKIEGVEAKVEGLGLTDYQLNALVSRAYNCGVYGEPPEHNPGALGPRNGKNFVQAYTEYWKEDDDLFEEENASPDFNHSLYTTYMDEPVTSADGYLPGLERRRKSEWALFQTGYYGYETNIKKWHPNGGAIVEAAYVIADHFRYSGVDVHYAGDDVDGAANNGRSCIYGDIEGSYTIPIENPKRYGVVCATFVSLALREAGLFRDDQINNYGYNSCAGVKSMLSDAGWEKITSYSELQPGDIWFESGHVAIYVGDEKYIDQAYCVIRSSGKDSRGQLRTASSNKFLYAYRYSN